MPSRRPLIAGTSVSPRTSSSAVNEVVNVISRKLNPSHTADMSQTNPAPPSRRSSFSMENILHPGKKEKKRNDSKDREPRKDKRKSLVMMKKPGRSRERSGERSPRSMAVKPAKIEMIVESPPLVLYGNANNSSGALFSGRLKLLVEDPAGQVQLTDFAMTLRATITTKKPISKECKPCIERHDELKKWDLLSVPKTFKKGENNQFPFSYLFAGNLPATTHAHLGSLTYSIYAIATASTGEKIEFSQPIKLQRAVPPGPEKASIRIFPPTNLTGRVTLPSTVHPIGTFPVAMTLSGVVEKRTESQTRWRLRKMMWRIEENSRVISSPCPKHVHKISDGKAMQHSDSRILGNDEMKSGWKTDFDTIGGEISLEFDASLATKSSHKATCAMESPAGFEVKHSLVVELIVAEEFCPNRNTNLITPTGAARVLRMQFALNVTERAGMGISWDEEQPPMYEDVPPSPPGYGNASKDDGYFGHASIEDYEGPELEPVDLERISTENPDDPPLYRERSVIGLNNMQGLNEGLPMRSSASLDTRAFESSAAAARRRLVGFQLDDLEADSAQEAWRRQRNVADEEAIVEEEDYGEGVAGAAPPRQ